MAKLDLTAIPRRTSTIYPAPHDAEVAGRSSLRLGDAGGLTQFGVNIVILEAGAKSSLRHWHMNEDEFVMMMAGTCTLVMDDGETEMRPGDCAAFPAGVANGHRLINRSSGEARFLVVGSKAPHETAYYSDHDLKVEIDDGRAVFTRRNGSPLPESGD